LGGHILKSAQYCCPFRQQALVPLFKVLGKKADLHKIGQVIDCLSEPGVSSLQGFGIDSQSFPQGVEFYPSKPVIPDTFLSFQSPV